MKWVVVAVALAVALAGCAAQPDAGPAGSCGAAALQGLVGQDAAVLDGMRFAGPVRVIRPGMAVTMDYAEGRLNVEVNEAGLISALRCG